MSQARKYYIFARAVDVYYVLYELGRKQLSRYGPLEAAYSGCSSCTQKKKPPGKFRCPRHESDRAGAGLIIKEAKYLYGWVFTPDPK